MKKYLFSLMTMLVLASLLVAGGGAYIKYEILAPMNLYQDKSVMELPFLMATDDALMYMVRLASQPPVPTEPPTEPPTQPPTEPPVETTCPPETEPPTEPVKVDESWFDDALFIGNSLGVGLRDYAPLGKANYFCAIGQSIFSVRQNWLNVPGVGNTTLERLLSTRTYGKVYIHLGTNECGYPVETVLAAYQELVDLIREKQPDAAIIIQATTTFGRNKAKQYVYMVPDTITNLNNQLMTLAEQENVYFIDFNPEVVDEQGYLPSSFSLDGCHPTLEGYRQWSQWIWDNACYLGIPDSQD